MKTTVVIGGGITGLSAMYVLQKELRKRNEKRRLILIEADESLGGKIKSVRDGEFIMETGADSIVARKSNVAPIIEELGIQDQVVYNATGISYIYGDGELKKIPADAVFGIPTSLQSLAESDLISAEGKVEALRDFYTPNETFTKKDSLGEFLETFLGKELVEKQIAPVISGVYSGELNELTIASTFPYLLDYKNKYGSIIEGFSANKETYLGNGNKKFISFSEGVSVLVDAYEQKMDDVEIMKGTAVQSLERTGERYQLVLDNQERIEADHVVISTISQAAQAILQDERLDEEFNQLRTKSMISVYLGFDVPDSALPADGTGFIVRKNSELSCDACTWTSRKWAHTSSHQRLLLRLFYKSSGRDYARLQQLSDEELVQVALQDVHKTLGLNDTPITANVTKWQNNMPNYHLKHQELVQSLEEKMRTYYPNVLLAGCSYYGVGIPDCIANGEETALQLVEHT